MRGGVSGIEADPAIRSFSGCPGVKLSRWIMAVVGKALELEAAPGLFGSSAIALGVMIASISADSV